MPEGLEAEIYRRAAIHVVGRTIASVIVDERQPMAGELARSLPGRRVAGVRRHGKHVVLDLDGGHSLGLHFGMTGRLIVDDRAAIEQLEYASGRDDPAWDRLMVTFEDGSTMRVNDPRRWAAFTVDPDLSRLGPDVFEVTEGVLTERLRGRRAAVKAVLLDQGVVAGYGNMSLDEVLWHASVSPLAPVNTLTARQIASITEATRAHLPAMLARGGSHTGTLDPEVRATLPPCPRDGAMMRRDEIGGRTTVWCPVHQMT